MTYTPCRLRAGACRLHVMALLLCLLAGPAHAAAPPWPPVNYSYFADNSALKNVLADFATTFGLKAEISPQVAGRVTGNFTSATPTEYLNRLAGIYSFVWYVHAGTLHISSASESLVRTLSVPGGNTVAARQALADLGVFDARFGWGDMADQGVVIVTGPPAYVELVDRTLASLPRAGNRRTAKIFRLQHAQVDDREIQYRDTQIVIPGVATVLRNLLTDAGGVGGVAKAPSGAANGALAPLPAGAQVAAAGSGPVAAAPDAAAMDRRHLADGSPLRPAVEAFPALNAVLVQDTPERLPVYAALISELDVATALIEVEAMVIDVDKNRMQELGVSWNGSIGSIAAGSSGAGTLSLALGTGNLLASAGNYFASHIRALEQAGDARVISRPSVVTADNVGAVMNLNQTFYAKTVGERVATVTPITASTTLKVTPRVVSRGGSTGIQLAIDVQDGKIVNRDVDDLPTVVTSSVSTQALVRDGESLLVGGYSTEDSSQSRAGVPVLSKIPVLGLLFGSRQSTSQQHVRMFLIRPHIVTLPGQTEPVRPPHSLAPIAVPAELSGTAAARQGPD